MNLFNVTRSLAAIAVAMLGIALPAQATVVYNWSAGATCGNPATTSFSTSGPSFQASLCASTTTERGCGFSAILQSNSAAESNAFSVTARTFGSSYTDANAAPTLPLLIANPATVADFGATIAAGASSALASANQLLATFTFQPQASATNASYVINLTSASEFDTDQGVTNCGSSANSTAALPTLTLSLSTGPAITSAATTTFTVGAAGTFNVTASGSSTSTFTASGTLPGGVSLSAAGVLSGTPASGTAGSYPVVITANNGSQPNGTQNFTLAVAKRSQSITFNAISGQAFSALPFTITGASASSGLPLAFSSGTSSVCSVSASIVTFLAAGTCTITANQTGNVDFNAAVAVAQSFAIGGGAPAAPPSVSGSAGNLSAIISFAAPAFNGGSAIIDYTATCVGSTGGSTTGAGSPLSVTGLVNGNSYSCTVVARNSFGTSPASTAVIVVPSAAPVAPGAPTIIAVSASNAQATLTFIAPASNGGSSITAYTASCNPGAVSATSATSPVTVNGLANSVTYSCTVTATNSVGTGSPSAPVTVTPSSSSISLTSTTNIAPYGASVNLIASLGGIGLTGTVSFSVVTNNGAILLPGCETVKLVSGTANCTTPGTYQKQNPRQYVAAYSGDPNNAAGSASYSQAVSQNNAVLSVAALPLPPIVTGRSVTLTALVKMTSPTGSVTFADNGIALAGCAQTALSLVPDAVDSAVATCTITAPVAASGVKQYLVTYFYPAGHLSGKVSEQITYDLRVVASGPADYTDMWWAGSSENGWGMSVTQHGPIQFNVIFAYDAVGKAVWYVMPGGSFNSAGTVFTGSLYLPTSSPFNAYDKSKFVIGSAVGSASITYTSNSTATLAYTINGISASKSIQRQIFALETTGENLRINDLWWATFAEDGWGVNISQQGRVLFPIWYTYDATGRATFFTGQGGSWSGTVWSGTIYAHTSAAWLGVAYNGSQFTATNVGSISIDFSDASTATMTTSVSGIVQSRRIERQPY